MRTLHINTGTTRNPNSQISRLEAIHKLINRHLYQIDVVENALAKIKPKYLTEYCTVYFKYLNARHHYNCYKVENAIEHLELASSILDDMDVYAYEHKIKVCHSEYHFTRAYVKFVLSTITLDENDTNHIKAKAERITTTALQFDPKSQKFIWLSNQLAA